MPNVLVTPENAALYGFDKIGATINTDTGGIVNPFSGPADGFDRSVRDAAIAARGPGRVSPGYSQIMSDPRNVAFNQRLLGDPQFAWDNLKQGFDRQVNGNNPMLFYGGSSNPLSGTGRNYQPKTDPLTGGSTAGVTTATGVNVTNPLPGTPNPTTTTAPAVTTPSTPPSTSTPESGQGLFGVGNAFDPSKTGGSAFQSSVPGVQKAGPEYNPRDGVVNAMTKQFKAKSWF